MRRRLSAVTILILTVSFLAFGTLQQMKLIPEEENQGVAINNLEEEIHGDMIKIPERVLNASRGVNNFYKALSGPDFINFTKNSTSKEGFFVFFGTNWCGHCKKFKPQFEAMAEKIEQREGQAAKPLMIYYEVEKDTEHEAKLFRVHGYPSLFYIYNNSFWEYDGKREEEDIFEWIDKVKTGEIVAGKPYPDRLPTFVESFTDGLQDTWKMIKIQYKYNFFVFLIIAGCLVLILSLCFLTIYQLLTEERGDVDPEQYNKKTK